MTNRRLILGCRFLLLGVLAIGLLPACSNGGAVGGSAGASGIIWNPTSTGTTSGGTPIAGGVLWNDPNTGGDGGFSPFIPSNDLVTYSTPNVYIANNIHPLSTASSAQNITAAEGGLMQALNAYRSRTLSGGAGGIGGGGGLGGGGFVVPPQNAFLQGHEALTRNARANCKHFALYHAGPFSAANPEGDTVNGGGVAPPGRLAKCGITTTGAVEILVSGPAYPDYISVSNYIQGQYGEALTNLQWTHIGCGYWTGGSQEYYWSVILARNPQP